MIQLVHILLHTTYYQETLQLQQKFLLIAALGVEEEQATMVVEEVLVTLVEMALAMSTEKVALLI